MLAHYVSVTHVKSIDYDDALISSCYCNYHAQVYQFAHEINSYRIYRYFSTIILYDKILDKAYLCPIEDYFIFTLAIIYPLAEL